MTEQLGLFDSRVARASEVVATPLSIRESRRARRLILRLLPPHTLELVVPRGTKPHEVQAFVHEHRRWIESARGEIAARYPVGHDRVPTRIELPSVAHAWQVRYCHEPVAKPLCRTVGDQHDVRTRDADHRGASSLLRAWLLEQARTYLRPWLLREAETVGRTPERIQVRLQRTRWGSCSSAGNISLNASLLFLEAPLVRYLLIHELCHLFSLNHSQRFWRCVERYEPTYRELDRQLTEAWAMIPLWAHGRAERPGLGLDGVG
jgi:predicted metal-dependent hydrolase